MIKALGNFLKTTLIGGFLFLLPLVVTAVVMREAVKWLGKLLEPVVKFLSLHSYLGVHAQYFLAVLLLLLVGFLGGLVAKTRTGKTLRKALENLILKRMPGYTLMRGLAGDPAQDKSDFEPVLIRLAPGKLQMAFIVERHADGWLTIFIPSAPSPTSGTVQIVTPDHLVRLKNSPKDLVMCLMKIGEGFEKLAGPEIKRSETPQSQAVRPN